MHELDGSVPLWKQTPNPVRNVRVVKDSDDVYHNVKALSSSGAGLILDKCPAHFKAWMDAGNDKDTPTKIFGRAFHKALFEPEDFSRKFALRKLSGNSAAARKETADMAEAGVQPIKVEEYDAILNMVDSVRNHPDLKSVFAKATCQTEISIYWEEEITVPEGSVWVPCKARIDALADTHTSLGSIVIDPKSTQSANIPDIEKAIAEYGYYRQMEVYMYAAHVAQIDTALALLAFVEKAPPYICSVVTVAEEDLGYGILSFREAQRRYAECTLNNYWPCPTERKTTIVRLKPWRKVVYGTDE